MATNNTNMFINPNNTAIENLKLKMSNAGIVMDIPAVDKHWVVKRKLNVYIPPPVGKNLPLGALEVWKQSIRKYIEDLKWLLSLKYFEFWSCILYDSSCMDTLVSFLQEATPPYLSNSHDDSQVQELYNVVYHKVFVVFTRLVTNKESESEWMSKSFLGKMLYEKYIFTIPILFDLCLLYGINNSSHIGIIVKGVFTVQPKYNEDLKKAISFVKQMFNFVSLQMDSHSGMNEDPPVLPELFKGFSKSFGGLRSKNNAPDKSLSLASLDDLCIHLSDCSLTVRLFMDIYAPSRQIFRDQDFHNSITNLYENTIPLIYKKVDEYTSSDLELCDKIFDLFNLIRGELVDAYRFIISISIDSIFDNSASVESNVNTYLTLITDILSEKVFLKDYNALYPVEVDLDVLFQAYDKMDPMKRDFILQAVMLSCYDDKDYFKNFSTEHVGTSSSNNYSHLGVNGVGSQSNQSNVYIGIPEEAKTQSLISEVKDILPHLGDGFILKCLEYYNLNTERVISGVLEGALDDCLQTLDPGLPIIPSDPLDVQYLKTGIDRLNVFDNDEFDVMSRDNIDKSKIHKGKKKFQHKTLTEMLDDKSHITQMKDIYCKYSLISDDVDVYDDEYDDTYDFEGPEMASDTIGDDDRRLNKRNNIKFEDNQDSEDGDENDRPSSTASQPPRDVFCVNPEEVRARHQARRETKYGHKSDRDVIGKAKGQGQDKDVLLNRQKKEAHKSNQGNHNRRGGAQWKRNQGMMPS